MPPKNFCDSKKQQEQFRREFAGDLYPEYFLLKVDDFDSTAQSSLEEWISFLRTGEIPESFAAPGLPEARERLKEATPRLWFRRAGAWRF